MDKGLGWMDCALEILRDGSDSLHVFEDKVVRVFGKPAREWLNRLDEPLQLAMDIWGLRDCKLSPIMSFNLIMFAESEDFGSVAVKLGYPSPEITSEIKALELFGGKGFCKCYDSREDKGLMLLERIRPGQTLDILTSSEDRIRTAAGLIAALPRIGFDEDEGMRMGLATYPGWLDKAFARARREGKVGSRMLPLITEAEGYYKGLADADPHGVLLHGDLHHENMLSRGGKWVAVDPKGVVGPRCMEAARFIENEINRLPADRWESGFGMMVPVFGEAMGETPGTIGKAVFILMVLSTCWSYEDFVDTDGLTRDVDTCEWYRDALARIR